MKIPQTLALVFWGSFLVMVIVETLYFQPWMNSSEYFFMTALFLSVLALGWVLADSKDHDLGVPTLLRICVVIAPFLAVPYYRFRYFGARAGFVFLGIVAGCFAGLLLTDYALQHAVAGTRSA